MIRPGRSSLFFLVCLALAGCMRAPPPAVYETTLTAKNLTEVEGHVLKQHQDTLDAFRLRGPFGVTTQSRRELRLSPKERIATDLFLAAPGEKAPLVIFLHGHDSSKEAHAHQAAHLASWGMHALTVQLPKQGPWISNGRTLARIVGLIHRSPQTIDARIDASRIVLVGYSFGASAVAVALAEGAPAAAGILLDPAGIGRDLPSFLRRINKPVLVLGADEEVSPVRNRNFFYDFVRSGIAELSIKDAGHEDAQFPSDFALKNFGNDPDATEELQLTFVSALTAAVMSLSATGTFDYAWKSFGPAFERGVFFNAKKK